MIDASIIIVNWNAKDDLRACLRSVLPPGATSPPPVWVVDNSSVDGSVPMVQAEFPQVHLIVNSENYGFSAANNQAIAESAKVDANRYVFLLNPDATLRPGALETLVAYADEHPDTGIVAPKVLNPDGTLQSSCRRFPTLGAGLFRNTYLGKLFPTNKPAADYLMADFDHNTNREVDWVSGCAMLIRRQMIEQIGALDERFFMYCEDVELCQRAWHFDWKVAYVPDAVATHAIGRSSDKAAERMIREFHKSWYEFDKKHFPDAGPARRIAVWAGLSLRAEIRILKRRAAFRRSNTTEPRPVRAQPAATPLGHDDKRLP